MGIDMEHQVFGMKKIYFEVVNNAYGRNMV